MICLNDEPHNLRFLDLSDTSMADKLILLRVLARPDVLPDASDFEHERALEVKLKKEIPHLLWFILHDFKMPKKTAWRRGEPCYREPELVSIAHEDDAVTRVIWLLGELDVLPTEPLPAPEWERRLRKDKGELAARILDSVSLGHVLRDAAKRFPALVQCAEGKAHGGLNKWKVQL